MINAKMPTAKFFSLGFVAALILMFLLGAKDVGPPNYGRYQVSSWGGALGPNGGGFGAFVTDTATGETKLVYSRVFGDIGSSEIKKDDLGKMFHSIK